MTKSDLSVVDAPNSRKIDTFDLEARVILQFYSMYNHLFPSAIQKFALARTLNSEHLNCAALAVYLPDMKTAVSINRHFLCTRFYLIDNTHSLIK